ncbi:MAG: hypothetical protein MZV70_15110 [Desulfobacterales bacterium]|nr:hypothetical protein [Desulfobacterales bacterium]
MSFKEKDLENHLEAEGEPAEKARAQEDREDRQGQDVHQGCRVQGGTAQGGVAANRQPGDAGARDPHGARRAQEREGLIGRTGAPRLPVCLKPKLPATVNAAAGRAAKKPHPAVAAEGAGGRGRPGGDRPRRRPGGAFPVASGAATGVDRTQKAPAEGGDPVGAAASARHPARKTSRPPRRAPARPAPEEKPAPSKPPAYEVFPERPPAPKNGESETLHAALPPTPPELPPGRKLPAGGDHHRRPGV